VVDIVKVREISNYNFECIQMKIPHVYILHDPNIILYVRTNVFGVNYVGV
jgi:hypothetical protein